MGSWEGSSLSNIKLKSSHDHRLYMKTSKGGIEIVNEIVLKIIPEPDTRTVIIAKVLPVFKGDYGDTTYLCGNCKAKFVEGINEGQIRNIVIKCPICRLYSEIP